MDNKQIPFIDDLFFFKNNPPKMIKEYLLEEKNPPSLSASLKYYYYLRPYIPLKVRQFLQGMKRIEIGDKWYYDHKFLQLIKDEFNNLSITKLWPDNYQSPLVLTHDVETKDGFNFIPSVIDIEAKYGFKSSWNIVPYLYPINKNILKMIIDTGNEIGIHGFNHDGKLYFSKKIFDKRKIFINDALEKYNATGFRSPAAHRNLNWLQELNIQYDASCFDIDPFQPMPGGVGTIWPFKAGKFIELPYTLPQDHVLWIQLRQKDNRIWEEKTNWIYENKGMILMITHPDYLMVDSNLQLYDDFLKYLSKFKFLWNTLPKDIVQHCLTNSQK